MAPHVVASYTLAFASVYFYSLLFANTPINSH
jgi:hypothetical protein